MNAKKYLQPTIAEITTEAWFAVPDNPRQRDTIARARKAWWLREPKATHWTVAAAVLPNGSWIKLDGHARALLWHNREIPAPAMIRVVLYPVDSVEAAKDLYLTFDAPEATENISDRLYGLHRELNVHFESELLASCRYSAAVGMAHDFVHGSATFQRRLLIDVFTEWLPVLWLFDSCKPTHNRFSAPVAAGALLLLRRYGEEPQDFLRAFQQNAGTKEPERMDAVQAFSEYVERVRHQKRLWGQTMRSEIARTAVACYEAYRTDRWYVVGTSGGGARPVQDRRFRKWLAEIRTGE